MSKWDELTDEDKTKCEGICRAIEEKCSAEGGFGVLEFISELITVAPESSLQANPMSTLCTAYNISSTQKEGEKKYYVVNEGVIGVKELDSFILDSWKGVKGKPENMTNERWVRNPEVTLKSTLEAEGLPVPDFGTDKLLVYSLMDDLALRTLTKHMSLSTLAVCYCAIAGCLRTKGYMLRYTNIVPLGNVLHDISKHYKVIDFGFEVITSKYIDMYKL